MYTFDYLELYLATKEILEIDKRAEAATTKKTASNNKNEQDSIIRKETYTKKLVY